MFNELDKIMLYYNFPCRIKYQDVVAIVGTELDNNNFHFVSAVVEKKLDEALNFVVSKAVNGVGVNINTASCALLKYVSGLNKKVIDNIMYISSLKKSGKIERFELHFTVTSINYKEIPQIINFCRQIDAKVRFLGLDCSRDLEELYKKINIQDKEHPDYNKLVKLVHSKDFISAKDVIIQGYDYFVNLKPISFLQKLKNKFQNKFN